VISVLGSRGNALGWLLLLDINPMLSTFKMTIFVIVTTYIWQIYCGLGFMQLEMTAPFVGLMYLLECSIVKASKLNFIQTKKIAQLLKEQQKIFDKLPDGAIIHSSHFIDDDKLSEKNEELKVNA
jgi:hypothetical protein